MDILNLPDYDVIERSQTALEYIFKVRYTVLPSVCTACGQMLPRLQKFGTMLQEFRDLPMHGKSVTLVVEHQRFRCQECKQTFIEKNGRVAVPLDMANKITSRNGHTFERVACEPQDYFLVDGEKFTHYHEAANEFQKRANPDRYTAASQ